MNLLLGGLEQKEMLAIEMVVVGKLLLRLLESKVTWHIGIWLIIAGVRSPFPSVYLP